MEFSVSRNALLRALQHVRCAITKQEIQVFKCFVFSFPAGDGSAAAMTVHASNGSVWMEETVVLDGTPVNPRSIAVWYGDLLSPIKTLDEQPLRFEVQEYQVIVHHSVGSFRLPLYGNPSEFFDFKAPAPYAEADDGWQLEYEAPCLKSILRSCSFAMAQDDLRPALNGVYFNLTDQFCDYVSSDGHKLVRVRKSRSADSSFVVNDLSFIIPSTVVKTLLKVLPPTGDATIQYQKEKLVKKNYIDINGHEKECTVTERKPQCRIIIDGNLTISFNTVEERYPNYGNVIPASHRFTMTVDRKSLIKSCDRLALFDSTKELIAMNIDESTLHLETKDDDFEVGGEEALPCECSVSGCASSARLRIGLKAYNLTNTLKALSTEKVTFLFEDSSRAVLIQPQPQPYSEEITMLIMPVFLSD